MSCTVIPVVAALNDQGNQRFAQTPPRPPDASVAHGRISHGGTAEAAAASGPARRSGASGPTGADRHNFRHLFGNVRIRPIDG